MDKELYVIDRKDNHWTFIGAFKTSKDADSYYASYNYNLQVMMSTIVPKTIPENFNTYFEQFKYCPECDKFPHDYESNSAFLIQKKHGNEYHFDCLLPTLEDANNYIITRDKMTYRTIPLKLPHNKDVFFDKIFRDIHLDNKESEKQYYDNKHTMKLIEKTSEIVIISSKLLQVIGLLVIGHIVFDLFF